MGTAKNNEEWRQVPGTCYTLSNWGRMKNRRGRLMAPGLAKMCASPRYCAVTNKVKHSWRVVDIMEKVWPDAGLKINREWLEKTRKLNGQFGQLTMPSRPIIGDPWNTMKLWNVEEDYFSFAQYAPVI